eukprot:1160317-Pelagomonas_calceolata.AAC.16
MSDRWSMQDPLQFWSCKVTKEGRDSRMLPVTSAAIWYLQTQERAFLLSPSVVLLTEEVASACATVLCHNTCEQIYVRKRCRAIRHVLADERPPPELHNLCAPAGLSPAGRPGAGGHVAGLPAGRSAQLQYPGSEYDWMSSKGRRRLLVKWSTQPGRDAEGKVGAPCIRLDCEQCWNKARPDVAGHLCSKTAMAIGCALELEQGKT